MILFTPLDLASMTTAYDFSVKDIDGHLRALSEWKGHPLLIVNVASRCGFTPQYEGLEALYQAWRERGLVVLGFPCNQFGHQEPGEAEEIKLFCNTEYEITFPLLAKIEVNGPGADPLYQWLTSQAKGIFGTEKIKWNFTKFLVGRDGQVLRRYGPADKPEKIEAQLSALLGA